jgi:hypothetical protein
MYAAANLAILLKLFVDILQLLFGSSQHIFSITLIQILFPQSSRTRGQDSAGNDQIWLRLGILLIRPNLGARLKYHSLRYDGLSINHVLNCKHSCEVEPEKWHPVFSYIPCAIIK